MSTPEGIQARSCESGVDCQGGHSSTIPHVKAGWGIVWHASTAALRNSSKPVGTEICRDRCPKKCAGPNRYCSVNGRLCRRGEDTHVDTSYATRVSTTSILPDGCGEVPLFLESDGNHEPEVRIGGR